jgi:protease-4
MIVGRRKWAIFIVTLLVVVAGSIFVVRGAELLPANGEGSFIENTLRGRANEKLVVLYVDGVIAEGSSFGSSFEAQSFIEQLNQVIEDDLVKALVLRINSPGGTVVSSDEIYEKIIEVQQAGKKVIVSMGNIAASGGYYIAAPADYIFANRATLTGSLGVIFTLPNYQGIAEWIGYKETNIQSGQFKDLGNPLRELREDEKVIYQALIAESYERFVDIIAEGRQLTREQTYRLADGRIFSGNQALERGLVDELGSFEDAIAYTIEQIGNDDVRVIEYERPFSLLDAFLSFENKRNEPISRALGELLPRSNEPGLMYMYQP